MKLLYVLHALCAALAVIQVVLCIVGEVNIVTIGLLATCVVVTNIELIVMIHDYNKLLDEIKLGELEDEDNI